MKTTVREVATSVKLGYYRLLDRMFENPGWYEARSVSDQLTVLSRKVEEVVGTIQLLRKSEGELESIEGLIRLKDETDITAFAPSSAEAPILAQIAQNFMLRVHSGAFYEVRRLAAMKEEEKRGLQVGSLYGPIRFEFTGLGTECYVPDEIIEGIRKYSWEKHEAQVQAMKRGQEKLFSGLGGRLVRLEGSEDE
ncbi:MAG: hypothetical protein WC595_01950 [Candidatus Nanoarchaeia archaeon]